MNHFPDPGNFGSQARLDEIFSFQNNIALSTVVVEFLDCGT
jgi:hypothetical protein